MELYFKYQRRVQDADVKIERELEVSFTLCLYMQTFPKEKLIHLFRVYPYDPPPKNLRKFWVFRCFQEGVKRGTFVRNAFTRKGRNTKLWIFHFKTS